MGSRLADNLPEPKPAPEPPWVPLVSVVMPVRDEIGFIEQALQQLLDQDYPADHMEIIVADGMSDDGTREALARIASSHGRVQVIDNPGRIVPTGLNAALDRSRGEVVIRMDGHVHIAPDFVSQSVALLREHPEAWCVGGPIVHVGTSLFGKAAAAAMSHPLGVGNANHRFADYEGYGEGTAFQAARRWVFDRVGRFDENLVRNQDDEWNFRVVQAGGRIYISRRIRYRYFVRDRILGLFGQYFQYSYWRIPVIRKHGRPTTLRQMIPALFFLLVALLLLIGIWLHQPWLAVALPATYFATLVIVGLSMVRRVGLAVALLVPVAMATMHSAYAAGMFGGVMALMFSRRGWSRDGRMATVTR